MERYPPHQEFMVGAEAAAAAQAMLAAYAVVSPDAEFRLIDTDFAPTNDSVPGSFTEASYPGYAAKVITWASFTHFQHETNGAVRVGSTMLAAWAGPLDGSEVTIYGAMIVDGETGVRMYRVIHFTSPVVLKGANTWLNLVPTVTFPAGYIP